MTTPYTLLKDLAHQVDPPADGTLSRTIYHDDRLKAVLFGFSAGQELSRHTSSTPAIMHFLSGEAEVGLGEDTMTAIDGTWIHMAATCLTAFARRHRWPCYFCCCINRETDVAKMSPNLGMATQWTAENVQEPDGCGGSQASQHGGCRRCVLLADAAGVFGKSYIEHPVQAALDAPSATLLD